jgi:hypothetical protein
MPLVPRIFFVVTGDELLLTNGTATPRTLVANINAGASLRYTASKAADLEGPFGVPPSSYVLQRRLAC